MRQLTFSARAPQAIGLRERVATPREPRKLRLIQGGLSDTFLSAREALGLCVFLLNLSRARVLALQALEQGFVEGDAEEQEDVIDTTTDEEWKEYWRQWEHSRENRRWTQRASMPRAAVIAFNKDLEGVGYALEERFECLSVTDRALGDFVRHYFVFQRKVGKFCEWMAESPILKKEMLIRPYGVEKFKDLATFADMCEVRSIMRQTLETILRALVAANFSNDKNGSRANVIIKNEMTGERFCCIVEKRRRHESIIAFYPVGEMNRKQQFRTARQLEHRLRRLH